MMCSSVWVVTKLCHFGDKQVEKGQGLVIKFQKFGRNWNITLN